MTCPDCGGILRHLEHYDYTEPETGYHDSGDRYSCRECGAIWDETEIEEEMANGTRAYGKG